jgi:hypothetical protein
LRALHGSPGGHGAQRRRGIIPLSSHICGTLPTL